MPSWNRAELEQHSLDMRQFIDFRQSTLPNGTRIIEAYNGSGLTFTLLPDRGLDIWTAHYNGIPLTWVAPSSPHAPDFGQTWLRQFNGGLLTTCGLTHAGVPETDETTGEKRDLHGNYTRLRANDLSLSGRWNETTGDTYTLELTGSVYESSLFGAQLRLTRRYTLKLGEPTIHLNDHVTNMGDVPVPFMLLYHINIGYPLVRAGARLEAPSVHVYPRDEAARPGFERWAEYDAASPGYAEQVFFHHVAADAATSQVMLHNGELGFGVEWSTDTLPYFTQWKNTRQGIYVSGLEPGNCLPEGQNGARRSGRLIMLQPGETKAFRVAMYLVPADQLAAERDKIARLHETGVPVEGARLNDFER